MILIDLSQCIYSIVLREPTAKMNFAVSKGMIYTTLLSFKRKFESQFGEPILAADSNCGYWRTDVFPHYKAARRASKKTSTRTDWSKVEPFVTDMHQELKECMPWKFIQVPGAEADDVIGCLGMRYGSAPTLILSSDKDYAQLQLAPGGKKQWITVDDPVRALQELILRGDGEDGIPNLFSDDDTFVVKEKRQTQMTEARVKDYFDNIDARIKENQKRYDQNRQLIDFTQIPRNIRKAIYTEYEKATSGSVKKLYDCFIRARLPLLVSDVESFRIRG